MPIRAIPGETDLATLRPDVAAEWHPTRNAELTPTIVTIKSNRKVWWKCTAGKHEWLATIRIRSNSRDCPYCEGRLLIAGKNDIASMHPDLAAQWHPTLNEPHLPIDFTERSAHKAWWLCPEGTPTRRQSAVAPDTTQTANTALGEPYSQVSTTSKPGGPHSPPNGIPNEMTGPKRSHTWKHLHRMVAM
ncbi:hypothetical protein FXW78_50040 [Rhodococcus opacus]|nr:hypothetical protein [Rhodococcus opacus]